MDELVDTRGGAVIDVDVEVVLGRRIVGLVPTGADEGTGAAGGGTALVSTGDPVVLVAAVVVVELTRTVELVVDPSSVSAPSPSVAPQALAPTTAATSSPRRSWIVAFLLLVVMAELYL